MKYITNDSQFNDEKRIQITNEIPPYDLSEGVHRLLKNDFWKWLLGYSYVTYDLDTKALYYNEDGVIDESIVPKKIVNGVESEVYGDPITEKWDPTTNSYKKFYPKNQIRMELNGVLLTENDLFLHEIYRYLQDLYPDHPDYTILLTEKEIKEAFWNMASMIDMNLDFNFLTKVIENVETPDLEAAQRERFKLWYKSLLTYAKNRKYFGSKAGMKMFAKQGLMETEVYSTGQYLPVIPESEQNPYTDISEYPIDHLDKNYKKLTRLIDWDNTLRKDYYNFKNFSNKKEFTGMSPVNMENITVELPSEIDDNGDRVLIKSNDLTDVIDESNKYDIFKDTKLEDENLTYILENNELINKYTRDGGFIVDKNDIIKNTSTSVDDLETSIEDGVNSMLLTSSQIPRYKTVYNFGNIFSGEKYTWENTSTENNVEVKTSIYTDLDLCMFIDYRSNPITGQVGTWTTSTWKSDKLSLEENGVVIHSTSNISNYRYFIVKDTLMEEEGTKKWKLTLELYTNNSQEEIGKVFEKTGNDSCLNTQRDKFLNLVNSGSNLSNLILKEPDYQKGYIGDDIFTKEEVALMSPLKQFMTKNYQDNNSSDIFNNAFNNLFMSISLYQFLDRTEENKVVTPIDVTYNPIIKNTLVLNNKESLKLYKDTPEYDYEVTVINVETEDNKVKYYNISSYANKNTSPQIDEDNYVFKPNDLVGFNIDKKTDNGYYQVIKSSPGFIKISSSMYDINENLEKYYESFKEFENRYQDIPYTPFEYYGFGPSGTNTDNKNLFGVILNSKDGEKIYVEGTLILSGYTSVSYNDTPLNIPRDIELKITSIPKTLPEQVMLDIYGEEKLNVLDSVEGIDNIQIGTIINDNGYKVYIRDPYLDETFTVDSVRNAFVDASKLVIQTHLAGDPFNGKFCYSLYNIDDGNGIHVNKFGYLGKDIDYTSLPFTYLYYTENVPDDATTLQDYINKYFDKLNNKIRFYDDSGDYVKSLIEYNTTVDRVYLIAPVVDISNIYPNGGEIQTITSNKVELRQASFICTGGKVKSIVLATTSVIPVLDNNSFDSLISLCKPNLEDTDYNFLRSIIRFAKLDIAQKQANSSNHYGYRYIPYINPSLIESLREIEKEGTRSTVTVESQNIAFSHLGNSFMNYLVFDDYNSCYYFNNAKVRLPIEVVVSQNNDGENRILDFKSEDAKRKFELLNCGDTVLGKGLSDASYILNLGNYSAELSVSLKDQGEMLLYFYVDYVYPEGSDETFNFEDLEIERGTFDLRNPENLGLFNSQDNTTGYPYVSDVMFPSSNIRDYEVSNTIIDAADGSLPENTFAKIMGAIYGDKLDEIQSNNPSENFCLVPSVLKDSKTLFFEVNLNKIFKYPNRAGSTNNLMCVDWLDFLTDNEAVYGTHSDNINVGTNLTLQTDRSGYYTLRTGALYTDDEIKARFQTFGWTDNTIPMYVQLGSGGQTSSKYLKSIDEITQPNVYGAAFYDAELPNLNKKVSELKDDGGSFKKRFTYFDDEQSSSVKELSSGNTTKNVTIDNFILESPIGEYDIQLHKKIGNETMTTINVSFYKQEYNGIEEKDIKLVTLPNSNKYEFLDSNEQYEYKGFYNSIGEANSVDLNDGEYISVIDETTSDPELEGDHFLRINLGKGTKTYQIKFGTVYYRSRQGIPFVMTEDNEKNSLLYQNISRWADAPQHENQDDIDKEIYFNSVNRCFNHSSYSAQKFSSIEFDDPELINKIAKTCFICKMIGLSNDINGRRTSYYVAFITTFDTNGSPSFTTIKLKPSYFTSTLTFNGENPSDKTFKLFILPCDTTVKVQDESSSEGISVPDEEYNGKFYNIFTYLDIYGSNKIQLQRGGILDGSQNITFSVDLGYKAEGYIINDRGEKEDVIYNVSKNPIFYDYALEEFYTYSEYTKVNGNNATFEGKVFIKFSEQKFFKDVKFLLGKFKFKNEFSSTNIEPDNISTLSRIEGIEFNTEDLAKTDRILEIKEAQIRTPYNADNESRFFTNTFYADYAVKGIRIENSDNPELEKDITYITGASENDDGISYDTKKFMFRNEINKIVEYRDGAPITKYQEQRDFLNFSDNDNDENNDAYCKISGGELVSSIKKFDDAPLFRYFKNLMLFKANLSISDKKSISGTTSEFDKVISNLTVGDEIIAAIPFSKDAILTNESKEIKIDKEGDVHPESLSYVTRFEKFILGLEYIETSNSYKLWYAPTDPVEADKDLITLTFIPVNKISLVSNEEVTSEISGLNFIPDNSIVTDFTSKDNFLVISYKNSNNYFIKKYEVEIRVDSEEFIVLKEESNYYTSTNLLDNYDSENIRVLDENGITTTLFKKGDVYVTGYVSTGGKFYSDNEEIYSYDSSNKSLEKIINLVDRDSEYEFVGRNITQELDSESPFKVENGLQSFSGLAMSTIPITEKLYNTVMGIESESNTNNPAKVNWYYAIAFCNELTKAISGNDDASNCVYFSNADLTEAYNKNDAAASVTPFYKSINTGFRLPDSRELEYALRSNNKSDNWYTMDESVSLNASLAGKFDLSGNQSIKFNNDQESYEWCYDGYMANGERLPYTYDYNVFDSTGTITNLKLNKFTLKKGLLGEGAPISNMFVGTMAESNDGNFRVCYSNISPAAKSEPCIEETRENSDILLFDDYKGTHSFIYAAKDRTLGTNRYYLETQNNIATLAESLNYNGRQSDYKFWVKTEIPKYIYNEANVNPTFGYHTIGECDFTNKRCVLVDNNPGNHLSTRYILLLDENSFKYFKEIYADNALDKRTDPVVLTTANALTYSGGVFSATIEGESRQFDYVAVTTDAEFPSETDTELYLTSRYKRIVSELSFSESSPNASQLRTELLGDHIILDVYKNSSYMAIPAKEGSGSVNKYKILTIKNTDLSRKRNLTSFPFNESRIINPESRELIFKDNLRPFNLSFTPEGSLVAYVDDDMMAFGAETITLTQFWSNFTIADNNTNAINKFYSYYLTKYTGNDEADFKTGFKDFYDVYLDQFIASVSSVTNAELEELQQVRDCLDILFESSMPLVLVSTNGRAFEAFDLSNIYSESDNPGTLMNSYSTANGNKSCQPSVIHRASTGLQVELTYTISGNKNTQVFEIPLEYNVLTGYDFITEDIEFTSLSTLPKEGCDVIDSFGEEIGQLSPDGQNMKFFPALKLNVDSGTTITSITPSQGTFKLSSKIKLNMEGTTSLPIILAIKTEADIPNQIDYMCDADTNSKEYFNYYSTFRGITYPRLRVVTEVDSYKNANFIYAPNELVENVSQESNDEYPSYKAAELNNEIERYYKYETYQGEIYPVTLTNDFGNTIYYCITEDDGYLGDPTGKKFRAVLGSFEKITYNTTTTNNEIDCFPYVYNLFANNEALLKAAKVPLSYESNFRNNSGLRYFGEASNSDCQITYYSRLDVQNQTKIKAPTIWINNPQVALEVIKENLLIKIDSDTLARYNSLNGENADTIFEKLSILSLDETPDIGILEALDYINYIRRDNVEGEYFQNYHDFGFKELDGEYYFYDANNDMFLPKRRLKMSGYLLTNYETSEEEVSFQREFLTETVNSRVRLLDGSRPVSKVFIDPKGYGSILGKSYFDEATSRFKSYPWSIDPEVFGNEILYNSLNKPIVLCDRDGKLITDNRGMTIPLRVPKYASFKNISEECEQVLNEAVTPEEEFAYRVNSTDRGTSVLDIKTIEEDSIDFENFLNDLDKNKEFYVRVKVLTNQDVEAPLAHRNDPDYYAQVNVNDIKYFPPNRVYFDPQGLPEPPIDNVSILDNTSDNKNIESSRITFRNNNKKFFYNYGYMNDNDKKIYECDEEGRYIAYKVFRKPIGENTEFDTNVTNPNYPKELDNEEKLLEPVTTTQYGSFEYGLIKEVTGTDGNCSSDLRLYQPYQPIYNSCEDWYFTDFYLEGQEQNPFTQVLKLDAYYDNNSKSLKEAFSSYSYKKSGLNMGLIENSDSDKVFDVINLSSYENDEVTDSLVNSKNSKILDCRNGEVKFGLFISDEHLKNVKEKTTYEYEEDGVTVSKSTYQDIKYGISYKCDNYLEKITEAVSGKSIAEFNSNGSYSYIVNSTEDLIDKTNKDKAIIQISELAILDKNKKVIAYAVFPPIEYRTDTQHISFTCLINDEYLH